MAGTPFLTQQQHKLPQPPHRPHRQGPARVAPPRLPRLQHLPDATQVNTETVEATCANVAQLIHSSQQRATRWIDARLWLLAKMTSTLQVVPQALQTCGAQRAKCAATTSGKPKHMPQGRLNVNVRSSPSVLMDSTSKWRPQRLLITCALLAMAQIGPFGVGARQPLPPLPQPLIQQQQQQQQQQVLQRTAQPQQPPQPQCQQQLQLQLRRPPLIVSVLFHPHYYFVHPHPKLPVPH